MRWQRRRACLDDIDGMQNATSQRVRVVLCRQKRRGWDREISHDHGTRVVASFYAAVLTGISLADVCSCRNIEDAHGPGQTAAYGRGIPPHYPPMQFTDHEFCRSMIDEVTDIVVLGESEVRVTIMN
eukprot:COSAG01_NODE_4151_length_5283_cov_3.521371_6_plen_127_part_00